VASNAVPVRWLVLICLYLSVLPVAAQDPPESLAIPSQFKVDLETAARLRPKLVANSIAASGRYVTGQGAFQRLVEQVVPPSQFKVAWELRIVDDNQLNAYSSPDGTVYVESGLARLAGSSAGLWAAILSHEIAHVIRRDWARRYLYEKYLANGGGASIVLGDPSLPSISWESSEKTRADIGLFARQMEVDADREGLMMMARAGYHPDFVPALHHLLHARGLGTNKVSLYALHPCWEERDRELNHAYVAASLEFARRWPEWYASPGGNPPVVVFADEPSVRKNGANAWQIQVPMRCQNLAGAVEVVLSTGSTRGTVAPPEVLSNLSTSDPSAPDSRQVTGCTSPKTTVTFTLVDAAVHPKPGTQWTDVYVLDAWGSVLARADLPKLPH
jgi:metalloendopeptidase OMA1, mitochondrial